MRLRIETEGGATGTVVGVGARAAELVQAELELLLGAPVLVREVPEEHPARVLAWLEAAERKQAGN